MYRSSYVKIKLLKLISSLILCIIKLFTGYCLWYKGIELLSMNKLLSIAKITLNVNFGIILSLRHLRSAIYGIDKYAVLVYCLFKCVLLVAKKICTGFAINVTVYSMVLLKLKTCSQRYFVVPLIRY